MTDSDVIDTDSAAALPECEQTPPLAPPSAPPAEMPDLQRRLDEALARERDARRALNLMVTILDKLPVGLTVQSNDGKTLFTNDTAADFFGATPVSSGEQSKVPKSDAVISEDYVNGPDGERTFLKSCRPAKILDHDLVISASIDFTERKQIETELSKRAYFDDLTGLPNRTLIQDHVEQLLAKPEEQRRFALAFIDIDNFKHINDYYTHAIGDALLVKVAQRIAAHVRNSDVVGRISGDEFLLVLEPVTSDSDLALIVDRILQELKEPFLIEGYEILTSASIGVSIYPDHGLNYEMLRRAADTAMYRIKGGTKGGAALFNSDMGRDMTVRMAQEQRLRLAVRDGHFCCAFQPKVDMRTEEVAGVEALIRLRDQDGLIQTPGEFIGLAAELGLIDDLTYLALGQILKSMALIDEAFGTHATVSINVAAQQAGDLEFMRGFCQEVASSSCAERFIVEVTEDAFLAKSRFQSHVLPMLREARLRVSIDDFGTGYSSLAQLADITADELKIDRSFITAIHQRSRSQSILKAIEALSDSLGMTVIAEGVETAEEAAFLQAETRIRYAQGFYYSKPIFMEELAPTRRGAASRNVAAPRERSMVRGAALTRR
ncbi:MAG TPA: EAL domain-containing protein [Xanthobacteraceae bacterium]|nr:EAL domain-containing protein [Xanthobacteraceae bacterium]